MADRAPLSIVVPTLDCADRLEATAGRLLEGVTGGLVRELIVCDGGSSDNVRLVADRLGARFVVSRPGRGTQLATGADAATGNWLLFLHADTHLEPGWSPVARQAMGNTQDVAFCFRLKFRAGGLWPKVFAAWANFRTRALGLPFGDQGLLIHRSLYDAVGGYSKISLMEDMDIAARLGSRWRMLPAAAETGAQRYRNNGWLRQGCGNLLLQIRYLCGADPEILAEDYRRRRPSGSKAAWAGGRDHLAHR